MAILLLTVPTGAGKNTIAALAANQRPRCTVVDFDVVRLMFVHPHKAPWEGDEGWDQHLLGVQMVCGLATRLAEAGWDVIVLDVLWDETARIYRQQESFASYDVRVDNSAIPAEELANKLCSVLAI